MKLYEITEQFKGLQKLVDDGDLSADDVKDTLEAIDAQFSDKVDACLAVKAGAEMHVQGLDTQIARLQALKKSQQSTIGRMNDYIRWGMIEAGKDKISTDLFSITLKKAGIKLGTVNEDFIDDRFFVEIPATLKLDRKYLLSEAKLSDIDGVELIESQRALLIK